MENATINNRKQFRFSEGCFSVSIYQFDLRETKAILLKKKDMRLA